MILFPAGVESPTKKMAGTRCTRGTTVLSTILTTVWPIVKKYGVAALAVVIGLGIGLYSFSSWKSGLVDQGYQKGVAECNLERSEANAKVVAEYQAAVNALVTKNRENQKEFENALQIYANRRPDVVIQRVPVRVKASCPSQDRVSGDPESGQKDTGIGGQFIEAELSPGAAGSITEIINAIQKLQDQCLLVKEAQRINQGD